MSDLVLHIKDSAITIESSLNDISIEVIDFDVPGHWSDACPDNCKIGDDNSSTDWVPHQHILIRSSVGQ